MCDELNTHAAWFFCLLYVYHEVQYYYIDDYINRCVENNFWKINDSKFKDADNIECIISIFGILSGLQLKTR